MAADLSVGARIYRPARWQATPAGRQVVIETRSMQDFGDGTVMLRAVPDAALAPHWRVAAWEEEAGRVCVCDEPIPENWTYFEVIFSDVNFVAVSPVAGDPEELRRVAQTG